MSDKCKCTHDIEQHNGFSGATTCEVRGCPCRRFTPAESASPSAPERFPIDKTDEWDMRDRPAAPATPQTYGKPYSHPMDDSFECQDSPPATPQLPSLDIPAWWISDPAASGLDYRVHCASDCLQQRERQLSAALSEVATLKKEAAEMKRQRDMLLNSDRHVAISSLQAEVAALREENERLRLNYYPGTSALYVPKAAYEVLKTQLADSQKKMDALKQSLEKIQKFAIYGCGTKQKDVRGGQFGKILNLCAAGIAIAEERAKP